MRRWIPMVMVSIVGVAALSGCGSDSGASRYSSTSGSTLPEPSSPEVVTVLDDVDYYGACGNEILTTDEGTFYPLSSDEVEALDVDRYPGDGATGDTEPAGFVAAPRMVAPPGPGDDVGTLVIYSDGIARFESDSGTVRWRTDEPREYSFVC
jgi:hypothetical protein